MTKRWLALAAVGALALVLASPGGGPALVFGQSVRYGYEAPPAGSPVVGYASYGSPVATPSSYSSAAYAALGGPGYVDVNYAGYPATRPSSWAADPDTYVAVFPPTFTGFSPAAAPPPPLTAASVAGRRALVHVEVPANATVWFNGAQTRQGGRLRTYETPALESGYPYTYDVKARWEQDGKPVERTQRIEVYPGGRITVAFAGPGA
jgi:uncharacterized protein (TIGR03000 family)